MGLLCLFCFWHNGDVGLSGGPLKVMGLHWWWWWGTTSAFSFCSFASAPLSIKAPFCLGLPTPVSFLIAPSIKFTKSNQLPSAHEADQNGFGARHSRQLLQTTSSFLLTISLGTFAVISCAATFIGRRARYRLLFLLFLRHRPIEK